ncbi:MAG: COX aromatic rich motif-containing protein [Bacteroidetes bacterium]|nr:COX aromatic rich motif-containing protein [Bacteroidota bacterium]MBU1719587.1 COX aromatic rich motif-containing protein [Bacteroidota bacterium]
MSEAVPVLYFSHPPVQLYSHIITR